jgi:hypothetical protein
MVSLKACALPYSSYLYVCRDLELVLPFCPLRKRNHMSPFILITKTREESENKWGETLRGTQLSLLELNLGIVARSWLNLRTS